MDNYNIFMLIAGIIVTIMGVIGVGKNQRKNQWIIQFIGDIGYRILLTAIGLFVIVSAFIF